MGNFKMKSPYNIDPTSVHEVPFEDSNLLGKANKNGTIIINNSTHIAGNPKKRDEIIKHEKHHLKEMIVDKNADGTPVLDYDAESVSYKGVKHPRSEFNEGNKGLPWEKDAYGSTEDIDFKGQLKTVPKMIGDKSGVSDEDEVSMGESFGPANRKGFMMEPRGQSNPFKYMEDKGLLGDGVRDGIDGGPGVYEDPMRNMAETDEMLSGPAQIEDIIKNPGDQQLLDDEALRIANENMSKSDWTVDPDNPEQQIRSGSGNASSQLEINKKELPEAKYGGQTDNPDEYIEGLKKDYPNHSYQDLVDGAYVHKDNAKAKSWWEENTVTPENLSSTQNVNEFRVKPIDDDIPEIPDPGINGDGTSTSKKKKRKIFNIRFNKNKTKKENTNNKLFCKEGSTGCGKEGNVNETIVKNKGRKKGPSQGSATRKANREKRRYRRKGGRY